MAVIEYARNVCGLPGANSTELVPECNTRRHRHPARAEEDRRPRRQHAARRQGHSILSAGSLASELYGNAAKIRLRFRHRYEVDPKYIAVLEQGGLVFSGRHPDYPIMQFLELPRATHPYFIATQAHPCLTSRPLRPDPLFVGLVKAALERKRATRKTHATTN